MLECVINVTEGRDKTLLEEISHSVADNLLDRHSDPIHNRSVFTLGASSPEQILSSATALAAHAASTLSIQDHAGVHPRFGVLDVVPFVEYEPGQRHTGSASPDAIELRDRFAFWISETLAARVYVYGPERSLPQVRTMERKAEPADYEPEQPNPNLGACAVGARGVLVAYNLVTRDVNLATARNWAGQLRSDTVRAIGLDLGDGLGQVSCNLIDPFSTGPNLAYKTLCRIAGPDRSKIIGGELVGLIPEAVLGEIDPEMWDFLGVSSDKTVESRWMACPAFN